MKQWLLEEPKKLTLKEYPPTPLDELNNTKVKIEQVMLNRTEISIYKGDTKTKLPFVLGRNAVGVVSEVENSENILVSKMARVVIEPFLPCGNCTDCVGDNHQNCEDMKEMGNNANGFMQNFVNLPASNLHILPDQLDFERALFVPYVALGLNILDALKVEKGRHIAVFASSKIGIITAQLLSYYQAVPILICDNDKMVKDAKDVGVFYAFNTENCDIEKEVQIITGGRMCRELIYFTNADFNMKNVYNVASFNATICVAGYSNKESKITVSQIAQKHISIIGVYNGMGNFSSAINLLVTNKVVVDNMIGQKLNFATLDTEIEEIVEEDLESVGAIVVID